MTKKEYVPRGYSQTNDCFAAVIVWAPDFKNSGRTIQKEFQILLDGIDSVIEKTSLTEAKNMLTKCKEEVICSRDTFLANKIGDKDKRREARKLLQHAYYEIFKHVGPMLKPGGDIGPDDDV